ncbi:Ubiquitin-fold modifier-conjugating enzyme [Trema orientale]|uniref:Ubiquitin-fold modifier-conjugating enzyme n=1 Tax=Trema orientale TaxID=63057 RepID=A0A2P5ECP4_TREOI|nr:Ubiquitin-fold modifier-conjugating enzyme [Trema orientale]
MDNITFKLYGYNDYIATLDPREAQEFYDLIKIELAKVSKTSYNSEHEDNSERRLYDVEDKEDEIDISFKKFNNFGFVQSPPSDHHFLDLNNFAKLINGALNMSLAKKITKELAILQVELPSSIYVQVYKARVDLMRVAIVDEKAISTNSHHHGMYFFDIRFPRDYPSKPPEVYYHSFGELHPSFDDDQDGKVSFNLLKYWHKWIRLRKEKGSNRKESPILKVLITIQQLVSRANSNYGEEKFMTTCNDKEVLMQTCTAMIRLLKSPPKEFEIFVIGYFRKQARRILLNYKTCINN